MPLYSEAVWVVTSLQACLVEVLNLKIQGHCLLLLSAEILKPTKYQWTDYILRRK